MQTKHKPKTVSLDYPKKKKKLSEFQYINLSKSNFAQFFKQCFCQLLWLNKYVIVLEIAKIHEVQLTTQPLF